MQTNTEEMFHILNKSTNLIAYDAIAITNLANERQDNLKFISFPAQPPTNTFLTKPSKTKKIFLSNARQSNLF